MPRRNKTVKELKGEGVMDILKGVNKFLRKHKIISKAADIAASVAPDNFKGKAKTASAVAKTLGYGLTPPGGGLRLAGQGKRGRKKRASKKK